MQREQPQIQVKNLTMAYNDFVVMRDLNFEVNRGEVLVIMGGSGSGKSTLLKHMLGLLEPASGDIYYDGENFTKASDAQRQRRLRRFGVLYQGGALWSSMTLAENVGLPLEQFTKLSPKEIRSCVELKLALVGLRGFEDYFPSELSGGMVKRAGIARAMAMDPEILFFDEPSAGLDPITSRRLDVVILQVRDSLGATVVVVTHELASIFAIADRAVFLDTRTRTIGAIGDPRQLREQSDNPAVRQFLNRGVDFKP